MLLQVGYPRLNGRSLITNQLVSSRSDFINDATGSQKSTSFIGCGSTSWCVLLTGLWQHELQPDIDELHATVDRCTAPGISGISGHGLVLLRESILASLSSPRLLIELNLQVQIAQGTMQDVDVVNPAFYCKLVSFNPLVPLAASYVIGSGRLTES